MYLKLLAAPADLLRLIAETDCGDHIPDNGAGCRQFPCSASIEHGRAQHISHNEDSVEHICHRIQRVLRVHEDRHDLQIDLSIFIHAGSEELDRRTHMCRVAGIHGSDFCDSLGRDLLVVYFFSCCDRSQDRDLSAGVISFNICLRVALRVAQFLGAL